jgi:hypothetical protein
VREGELEPSGEYAIGAPRSLADCVRGEIFASQVRMILIEFVHGCHTARKECHTPPQPRQDSLGNSGDPNARVAFAGENKDFLRESIASEAKSLQQPCLMASSSPGSPCTRPWNRSNRTYGSFELSHSSFLVSDN